MLTHLLGFLPMDGLCGSYCGPKSSCGKSVIFQNHLILEHSSHFACAVEIQYLAKLSGAGFLERVLPSDYSSNLTPEGLQKGALIK